MKTITILQPWASLIACGAKQIETRSWATKYRGKLAIHAGKSESGMKEFCENENACSKLSPMYLVFGAVIAIADLVDCLKVVNGTYNTPTVTYEAILENGQQVGGNEIYFGDLSPGHYAWILANIRKIDPVPAKGMQRIWEWEGDQDK